MTAICFLRDWWQAVRRRRANRKATLRAAAEHEKRWPTVRVLLGTPAAVDHNVRSGNEARVLGAEIYRELTDVFHLAPVSERNPRDELGVEFCILQERQVHFGGEGTGADAVQ